jgi:hypothetical protein
MHEDAIASAVQAAMECALSGANASRPFMVQTLLPSAAPPDTAAVDAREAAASKKGAVSSGSTLMKNAPGYPKDTVRADHTLQQGQLEAFLTRSGGDAFSSSGSKRAKGDSAQISAQDQGGWTRGQSSTAAGSTLLS